MSLLEVQNLHIGVAGRKIGNGLTLTVEKGSVSHHDPVKARSFA
jgi:hypothetical protein